MFINGLELLEIILNEPNIAEIIINTKCLGKHRGNHSGAAAGIALQHALQFFGVHTRSVLETDSSAAHATRNRRGIGKLRHLEANTLWLQAKVNAKEIAVQCIAGDHNPADLGTKALAGDRVAYLKILLNVMPIDYSLFGTSCSAAVVASIRVATPHKRGRQSPPATTRTSCSTTTLARFSGR